MSLKRPTREGAILGALLVLILVVASQPGHTQTRADTLIWVHSSPPRTLDPHISDSASVVRNALVIYEALVRYKYGTLELEPALATSWEVGNNGRSYVFELRRGVKFHDGTEFDADAVKTSFDRYKAIGSAVVIDPYEGAEVLGKYRVRVNLKRPHVAFINMVAKIWIVSPRAVQTNRSADDPWARRWFFDNGAGTGAYRLVRWVTDQQVILDRFDDYWGGWDPRAPRRVVHAIIREPATQRLLLERGEVDMALSLSADDMPGLQRNPQVVVNTYPTLVSLYFRMVTFKGPLRDVKVRRAVQLAFNSSGFFAARRGLSRALQGPLPSGIPFARQFAQPYDLERARALLAEAGYPQGGFELTFQYTSGFEEQSRSAEILQAGLSQLGIRLRIIEGTYGSMVAAWGQPDTTPDISAFFVYPGYPDPDTYLFQLYHSASFPPAGQNPGRYRNSQLDDLLIRGQVATDRSRRAEIYREVQEIAVANALDVFVSNPSYLVAMRSRVKGYLYNPAWHDTTEFYRLRLDR